MRKNVHSSIPVAKISFCPAFIALTRNGVPTGLSKGSVFALVGGGRARHSLF